MKKIPLWIGLIGILTLATASYVQPHEGLFWLAGTDTFTQVARVVLGIFIIAQLVTKPPRLIVHRVLTGVAAGVTAVSAIYTTTLFSVPVFDTIVFAYAAVALAIVALEPPAKETRVIISDIPVYAR